MILKKAKNIIGLAQTKKNLFDLNLKNNVNRMMITQKRGQPTYQLNKNPKLKLWHSGLTHARNA